MNFKLTTRKENSHRNNLIFFGMFHFIVWLMMCLGFGWWGVLLGFLVNCITDTGLLLSWILQEKKALSQELAREHKEKLLVQNELTIVAKEM